MGKMRAKWMMWEAGIPEAMLELEKTLKKPPPAANKTKCKRNKSEGTRISEPLAKKTNLKQLLQ